MKRILPALMTLATAGALAFGAAGCGSDAASSSASASQPSVTQTSGSQDSTSSETAANAGGTAATERPQQAAAVPSTASTVRYDEQDLDASWSNSSASFITLADGSVRFDGAGATVSGNTLTITSAGTYVVAGTSNDAQIVVDLEDKGLVKLVLNGANLTCADSSPVYVKNASKTVITLADGTQNSISDGAAYSGLDASGEPNAAVFGSDDLTFNGTGTLMVKANYKNGIASKNDLKIVSGAITVEAVGDGFRGKDSIGIKDGTITVTAGGDGFQATNTTDASKGFVDVQGGTVRVTAEHDGVQAQTTLLVAGGDLTLATGGGSANAPARTENFGPGGGGQFGQDGQQTTTSTTDTDAADAVDTTASDSAKGLKSAGNLFVLGGQITIDSADDSIHANGAVTIDGGTVSAAAGNQGIQGVEMVAVNGGAVEVTKSREGIESTLITIKDGDVRVAATSNGLNTTASATSSVDGGMGVTVDGGYVYVDAMGDGIDANEGSIYVNGGTVIVNGPSSNGDGPLDYQGECKVTGGYLLAVGSSGMAQAAGETSTQYSLMVNIDSSQQQGTLVHIQDEDGNEVLTFLPTKAFQSVLFSSPVLKQGGTYTLYLGGDSTGAATDGLYSGGSYSGGSETVTLTLSDMVTTSGQIARMGGGMQGGGFPGNGNVPGGGGRTRPGETTST